MRQGLSIVLLSIFALVMPLLLSGVYIAAMHGEAFKSELLHKICTIVIIGSSLPVIALLPAPRILRILLGVIFIPINFYTTFFWTLWLACAVFHSCP